jgi:hypothetical protein
VLRGALVPAMAVRRLATHSQTGLELPDAVVHHFQFRGLRSCQATFGQNQIAIRGRLTVDQGERIVPVCRSRPTLGLTIPCGLYHIGTACIVYHFSATRRSPPQAHQDRRIGARRQGLPASPRKLDDTKPRDSVKLRPQSHAIVLIQRIASTRQWRGHPN